MALRHDLDAELADAVDRKKTVEGKLSSIASITPVPVTIILAVVTFLSSARVQDFGAISVVILVSIAFLIALQFLRALLAAVHGLSQMSYWQPRAVISIGGEAQRPDMREMCVSVLRRIDSYDANTNEKVNQLALAHKSLENSVLWLLLAIAILGFVTVWETFRPAATQAPAERLSSALIEKQHTLRSIPYASKSRCGLGKWLESEQSEDVTTVKPLLARLSVAVKATSEMPSGGGTYVTKVARETTDDN